MCNQTEQVVETTQEKKVSHIYDAFNLTKEQSRSVIDKTVPIMQKYADYNTGDCKVVKECMDAVEGANEKLYATYLFGIFYGISQNSDITAEYYFSKV